jgi:hypothetical protein
VKIYLLSIDKHRFFFYSDVSESSDDEDEGTDSSGPARPGLRGWLLDRFHRFQTAWQESQSGVARGTKRAWDWLHSWAHPDEVMLARLRRARRIELHHPASRPADEVRALWSGYLNHRWWRHLFWLSGNAVIAPFTVLFAILPGPNVIGYWFAYRAIHHLLIVWGIRRIRGGTIPLKLRAVTSLDRPIELDEGGKAKHVAIEGAAVALDEHVAWSESETGPPASDSNGPRDDRP